MEALVRKIGKNDSYTYNHEVRIYKPTEKERIQKKRLISAREFYELQTSQQAQGYKDLKKFRQCFIYEQQYFMVETFVSADSQPSLLRIETSKGLDTLLIPSFCKSLREVTQDDNYASSTIAKVGWKMPEEDKKLIQAALNQIAIDKQASV